MRVRSLLMSLLAVVALSACGGDGNGDHYSQAVRDLYLEGCGGNSNEAFCECTLNELENRFTEDEFIAFSIEASEEPPQEFVDISLACLGEFDPEG